MTKLYIKKNIILTIIFTLIAIYIATFLWNIISIPFNTKVSIIGNYYLQKYNPINEIIRYIVFIILPLLTFFFCIQFFFSNNLRKIKDIFFSNNLINSIKIKNSDKLNYSLISVLLFAILGFISTQFTYENLDFFHEGQKLTPVTNYFFNNGLWTSTFIVIGVSNEILQTLLVFNLFDIQSIGGSRIISIILNLVTKISIIFLIFQISRELNLKENFKVFFFIITSLLIIILTEKNIVYRDLPIFIFLNFLAYIFSQNKTVSLINFLTGLLSVISFLWSIDKGAYLNFVLIILLIFYLLRKENVEFILVFMGIVLGWIAFYLVVGHNEFLHFYNNTKEVLLNMEYVNGIIHPLPFSSEPHAGRATKVLVATILSGIMVINLNFFKNKMFNNKFKLFYFFFFIFCVTSYRNALGLSDGYHIKHSEGFSEILIITLIVYYFLNNIIKNKLVLRYENNKIIFNFIIIILITSIIYVEKINIKNVINFNQRAATYINSSDDLFLSNEEKNLVVQLKKIFKDEKCVTVFTEDSIIPYLIEKPTCSKFYMVLGGMVLTKHEKTFISELKTKKAKYIILDDAKRYKDIVNYTSHLDRFLLIKKYVKENYYLFKKINMLNVYKLK